MCEKISLYFFLFLSISVIIKQFFLLVFLYLSLEKYISKTLRNAFLLSSEDKAFHRDAIVDPINPKVLVSLLGSVNQTSIYNFNDIFQIWAGLFYIFGAVSTTFQPVHCLVLFIIFSYGLYMQYRLKNGSAKMW